jgi:hypothetical protein
LIENANIPQNLRQQAQAFKQKGRKLRKIRQFALYGIYIAENIYITSDIYSFPTYFKMTNLLVPHVVFVCLRTGTPYSMFSGTAIKTSGLLAAIHFIT